MTTHVIPAMKTLTGMKSMMAENQYFREDRMKPECRVWRRMIKPNLKSRPEGDQMIKGVDNQGVAIKKGTWRCRPSTRREQSRRWSRGQDGEVRHSAEEGT